MIILKTNVTCDNLEYTIGPTMYDTEILAANKLNMAISEIVSKSVVVSPCDVKLKDLSISDYIRLNKYINKGDI